MATALGITGGEGKRFFCLHVVFFIRFRLGVSFLYMFFLAHLWVFFFWRRLTREGMASEKKSHRRQALVTVPPVDSSESKKKEGREVENSH
ncbi:unnamed protein product, partial [Linum tenue]